jgi:hypothetical protein
MQQQEETLLLDVGCEVEEVSTREYNVAKVNSLKTKYPDLRQRSKVP